MGPQFPNSLILSVILLSTVWLIWRLRKILGPVHIFLLLSVSHVMLVFLMHPRLNYLVFLLLVLGIPLFLLQFGSRRPGWPAHQIIPSMLFLIVVVDLLCYSTRARGLWDLPRPDTILGIQPIPTASTLAATRQLVTMTGREVRSYGQAMRYTEILYRTPTVFTALMDREDGTSIWTGPVYLMSQDTLLQELISGRRWNSYLMLKPYYQLIYADIPSSALRQIFSVGSPLIQFKSKALHLSDQAGPELLRAEDTKGAGTLLEHTVLVTGDVSKETASSTEALTHQRSKSRSVSEDASDFTWQVDRYDYSSLELTVSTSRLGYLYWADGYDRYWKATVGDVEVPVLRANINFKAIQLPPGSHRVRFVYDPQWYRISIQIFLGAQVVVMVVVLLLWGWNWRQRSADKLGELRRA